VRVPTDAALPEEAAALLALVPPERLQRLARELQEETLICVRRVLAPLGGPGAAEAPTDEADAWETRSVVSWGPAEAAGTPDAANKDGPSPAPALGDSAASQQGRSVAPQLGQQIGSPEANSSIPQSPLIAAPLSSVLSAQLKVLSTSNTDPSDCRRDSQTTTSGDSDAAGLPGPSRQGTLYQVGAVQ
jgi:hypothetical protein